MGYLTNEKEAKDLLPEILQPSLELLGAPQPEVPAMLTGIVRFQIDVEIELKMNAKYIVY